MGIQQTIKPLARPDFWARGSVVRWDGIVDVNQNTRVGGSVCAGERDFGTRSTIATPSHSQLATSDIELSATLGFSTMKGDVLDANQIVARRSVGRDRGQEFLLACLYIIRLRPLNERNT